MDSRPGTYCGLCDESFDPALRPIAKRCTEHESARLATIADGVASWYVEHDDPDTDEAS